MISPPFLLYIITIPVPESEKNQDFLVNPRGKGGYIHHLFDNFVEILKWNCKQIYKICLLIPDLSNKS
ncbi:MAG: hypothetical protein DRQ03_02130 [Candidatus Hydrothermota bacterium]|nr:MAG: hypothetical protein DRQ03_02130 [Candidatus Hydrothermae bacterium]